jgi:hypothetical protein
MSTSDELRKLTELHEAGSLTDQEFADAKKRTLAETRPAWPTPASMNRTFREAAPLVTQRTYKSSRWSMGNFFFPDRLTVAEDGLTFRKGAMFGSSEEHISYKAVASYRTSNGIFLATICIETSGGSQPIIINGLWKSEAKKIQDTISTVQSRG